MELTLNSASAEETEAIAARIGEKLTGGEVIELVSDLGGGKTTFVRGLVRGAGSQNQVSSPTFTINQIYRAPKFDINHFDFYRLSEPGIMSDELAEVIGDKNSVVVVEWGEVVADVLPEAKLTVNLKVNGKNDRKLVFTYPEKLSYLIPK